MIDYKQYPKNWKTEIRPAVLKRAGEERDDTGSIIAQAKCEICGVLNHDYGWRDSVGSFYCFELIESALDSKGYDYFDYELANCYDKSGNLSKGVTIVLTVAHLDHDKENHDVTLDRLQALCQRCHLKYDREHHMSNAAATRAKKKGQQKLF